MMCVYHKQNNYDLQISSVRLEFERSIGLPFYRMMQIQAERTEVRGCQENDTE